MHGAEVEGLTDVAVEDTDMAADGQEQRDVRIRLANEVEWVPLPLDSDAHEVEAGSVVLAGGERCAAPYAGPVEAARSRGLEIAPGEEDAPVVASDSELASERAFQIVHPELLVQ